MYTQAIIPVENEKVFGSLKAAVDAALSTPAFFKSVQRASLRIRDWDGVLGKKFLGKEAAGWYAALGDSDRAQIREYYLAQIEQTPAELRKKYLKVFSYY
jgi:hypothetical protein